MLMMLNWVILLLVYQLHMYPYIDSWVETEQMVLLIALVLTKCSWIFALSADGYQFYCCYRSPHCWNLCLRHFQTLGNQGMEFCENCSSLHVAQSVFVEQT